jgi:hypothetical protein
MGSLDETGEPIESGAVCGLVALAAAFLGHDVRENIDSGKGRA